MVAWRRGAAWILLALTTLGSGCFSTGNEPEPMPAPSSTSATPPVLVAPPPPPPLPSVVELSRCKMVQTITPVPVSSIRGFLPEGFTAAAFQRSLGVPTTPADQYAALVLVAYTCAGQHPLVGTDATTYLVTVGVIPPADLATGNDYLVLEGIVPDIDWQTLWSGQGIPLANGTVKLLTDGPIWEAKTDAGMDIKIIGAVTTGGQGNAAARFFVLRPDGSLRVAELAFPGTQALVGSGTFENPSDLRPYMRSGQGIGAQGTLDMVLSFVQPAGLERLLVLT